MPPKREDDDGLFFSFFILVAPASSTRHALIQYKYLWFYCGRWEYLAVKVLNGLATITPRILIFIMTRFETPGGYFTATKDPPMPPPHFPQRARVESQVCKLYFNLSLIFLLSICIGVLILFICCVHYADCSAALVTWNLYVDNIYYGHLMVFTLDLFMCIYYWANPDLLPRLSTPSLFIQ